MIFFREKLRVFIKSLPKRISSIKASELITCRVKLAKQIVKFNAESPIKDLDPIKTQESKSDVNSDGVDSDEDEDEDEEDEDEDDEAVQVDWESAEGGADA